MKPLAFALLLTLHAAASGVVKVYNFSGVLPYTALDFILQPFAVPDGVVEIEISHALTDPSNTTNILDWGLLDPNGPGPAGFRGWGGGNTEPVIVGALASSRSYVDGPIQSGTWNVVIGKPRIAVQPGHFSINVTLRDVPTLPPQTQRQPYVPCAPLDVPPGGGLKWYAGDFHVHSRESGDAFATANLDEVAAFATSQGLDFVHLSDHNTVSTSSFVVDAQSRHPKLLLLPGVEYTTYYGHAGAIGTTQYVDHKIGNGGATIAGAADAVHAQGGLFSINHFNVYEQGSDLRNQCVGCAWDYEGALPLTSIDAMEVAIQSWNGLGFIWSPAALQRWDHLHALGYTHIAPLGGSDDHHGGANETSVGNWRVGSPIGSPVTMVLAANLSHAAILEGVRLGRVALKMDNASDPSVDLLAQPVSTSPANGSALRGGSSSSKSASDSDAVRVGGTLPVGTTGANLTAVITFPSLPNGTAIVASAGAYCAVLVRNNEVWYSEASPAGPSPASPWTLTLTVPAPLGGTDRWRLEVHEGPSAAGRLLSFTNHVFFPSAAR